MKLQDHRVWLNGIVEYGAEAGSVNELFRSVYRHYHTDYPKFFKMDNLCKLAFLSAEIAIRHKMKGENAVFILEQFDPGFIDHYVSELFRNQEVSCRLSGWVECYGDHYQSFLFIIEQEDKIKRFKELQEYVTLNILNVEKLFKGKST